ncbi:MAG: PAS domain S-box protein [Deltaproteobacteria bacterium]|nr:PAS domain S-box protein [Deltaproteobacteria bacterium]
MNKVRHGYRFMQKIKLSITSQQHIQSIKRKFLPPLILAFVFILITNTAFSTVAAGQEPLSIKVGAYANHPKIYMNENGKGSGFWPDLIEDIAKKENWKIEYIWGTWSEGLDRLKSEEIDIMPDVAFTEKRNELYAFSEAPVLISWTRMYVNEENTEIQSITDLKNKKIAALKGSVNLEGSGGLREIARGFNLDCTFLELDDYTEVFKAVEENRADAGITNRNFGNKNAKNFKVKRSPIIFQPINMKFAFPKDAESTPYLSGRINYHIKQLKQDENSIYYRLLGKYFESEIAEKEVFPKWLGAALKTIAALFAFFILVIIATRIQVKRKTKEILAGREVLQASEERYRSIFENTGTATLILEEDKTMSMVNSEFERLSGYSREELEGRKKWTEFVVEEDFERMKEYATERRKNGGKAPTEYDFRFADREGNIKDIFIRVGMIPGTGKSVASLMDITPLKRAEESLRQSEEKYREFFEASKDTVYITSVDGKFIDMNDAGLNLFGIKRDDLDKINIASDIYADPADRVTFTEIIDRAGFATSHEINLKRMDGTVFPATIATVTIKDADENVTGYQGIIRDETERRRLETQFQKAQKMEAIGTLAGGIAHDFNNLLTAIQGNTSLMLMQIDSGNPEYERLKSIEQCVKSGADLTKQLLGFARGGAYDVKPTNLNDIVRKTSDMFGRTKKEIVIHSKYSDELWTAEVDPGQMEQVFINLYVNAWQAMPAGGDLYIETENVNLDENYVRPYEVDPGKYVKVSVTDTGVGMDEATRIRIFEPFFTTREMGRGTGLGLASAYGIIKRHRGIINTYSEKGHGTTFNIYLPASESVVRAQVAGIREKQLLAGHETILLVDDEEMIIDVATQMLQGLGYKILTAGSGEEAIEIYRKNQDTIDLVILDMIMPGLGGGETYDRLKDINSDIRVVLSSGYSINGQASRILERGCNSFIQKPFSMKALSMKVREVMEK